jgi:hypothetical protein
MQKRRIVAAHEAKCSSPNQWPFSDSFRMGQETERKARSKKLEGSVSCLVFIGTAESTKSLCHNKCRQSNVEVRALCIQVSRLTSDVSFLKSVFNMCFSSATGSAITLNWYNPKNLVRDGWWKRVKLFNMYICSAGGRLFESLMR